MYHMSLLHDHRWELSTPWIVNNFLSCPTDEEFSSCQSETSLAKAGHSSGEIIWGLMDCSWCQPVWTNARCTSPPLSDTDAWKTAGEICSGLLNLCGLISISRHGVGRRSQRFYHAAYSITCGSLPNFHLVDSWFNILNKTSKWNISFFVS